MATYYQLYRRKVVRTKKKHTNRVLSLRHNPFKRGFITKIYTEKPKKPNSAKRRVVKVKLCTEKYIRAQVPGEGIEKLVKFNKIMIRGGHVRDLPGIRYRVIRGKLDMATVKERKKARSKYGVKKYTFEEYQQKLSLKAFRKNQIKKKE